VTSPSFCKQPSHSLILSNMSTEQKTEANEPVKVFVVLRNGFRVSNSEYETADMAQREYDYWANILRRWPDNSKLEIKEIKQKRKTEMV
jgi:hypothetical protein